MLAYASPASGTRNKSGLLSGGWRLLVSPRTNYAMRDWPDWGFPSYALDNGAWTAFTRHQAGEYSLDEHESGQSFDSAAFLELLRNYAAAADWVVLPDIVGLGVDSLNFSAEWLDQVQADYADCLWLVPVQDGVTPDILEADERFDIGPRLGIFLGGHDDYKNNFMTRWGQYARRKGAYYHIGRVNTKNRLKRAAAAQASSFDGSGVSVYDNHRQLVEGWLQGIHATLSLFEEPI